MCARMWIHNKCIYAYTFPTFFFPMFFFVQKVAPSSAPGRSEGDLSGPDPMDPWGSVHQPGWNDGKQLNRHEAVEVGS